MAFSPLSWGEDGLHELPDQSIYVKDGLFLKVALLDNPQSFLAEWNNPLRAQAPTIKTRTVFHRGEVVFPVVLYSTNGLTPEGKAEITYSLLFRRPDGSIYENPQNLTVVNGVPAKGVGLCKDKAGLKIEENDPFGDYMLKVMITDKVKDVPVEMLFTFSVVDPAATPAVPPLTAGSVEEEVPAAKSPKPQDTGRMRSFSSDQR
ncbi:MAG: hypothetical protein ACOYM3_13810 [Terrimicrobiaceae bacterium]